MNGAYIFSLAVLGIIEVVCFWYMIRQSRKTMYSYRLMMALGLSIFIGVTIIRRLTERFYWEFDMSPEVYLATFIDVFWDFANFTFPIAMVVAALMFVSSLIMTIKGGRSKENCFGMIMGVVLVAATLVGGNIFSLVYDIGEENADVWARVLYVLEVVICLAVSYLDCMLAASFICTIRATIHRPKYDKDYMVILGCYAGKDGKIGGELKLRTDKALKFAQKQQKMTGKNLVFVPSGGQGSDEQVSEAEAMEKYLKGQRVPEKRILLESKSRNTRQNMLYSKRVITEARSGTASEKRAAPAKVAFATTGYHVFRSGVIAEKVGLRAEGTGARTGWYYYINAGLREFVANMASEWKAHALNLGIMIIVMVVIVLRYMSYALD